ncbi:MAG: haloacid dehalogenase-like hydrolase, partial [Chloroflexi bacterium]|nr:haloacid dehalogenase-like hydrolase [Chloroflexota bacterium]
MTTGVFLFDVDNTLLDNDSAKVLLDQRIRRAVGEAAAARFWAFYEAVRAELAQVDVPETVQRLGRELDDAAALARLSEAIYGLDFAAQLLPGARASLVRARSLGLTVLLSDGDQRFQRHKIRTAGLEALVEGRVLIYPHKEREAEAIRARFPADHYVLIDDKPGLHAAMKAQL